MRVIVVAALSALILSQNSFAQSISSGSDKDPDGSRPTSTQVDFFELMESGGELFLDLFRAQEGVPTIDEPEWNSFDSPRATFMTFVEAMNHVAQGRIEAWPTALNAFDGSEHTEEELKVVANDLLQVIDRLPEVTAGAVPGKETVNSLDLRKFELFPRGIDSAWLYRVLDGGPKGTITLVEDEGRWTFSEDTVADAASLAESMMPLPPRKRMETRGAQFLHIVGPTFQKTDISEWLMGLLALAVGIVAAWASQKGLTYLINKLKESGDDMVSPLLIGMRFPLMVILFTFGLLIASAQIHFEPTLSEFRWKIIKVLLVLAGLWLLVTLIELLILGVRKTASDVDDPYMNMSATIIRRCVRICATIILTIFVLQNLFAWNISALVGGVGLAALAVSLAAKDAVQNLFGALTIFANRPFLVGDWVIFDKEIGVVEDVSVQVTRIRLLSGEVWSVPNMKFVNEPVENLSMRKYLRRVLKVSLTYDTPVEEIDKAMSILDEILRSDDVVGDGCGNLDKHPPHISFTEFESDCLIIRADYWYLMDPEGNQMQRDTERSWLTYLDHCTTVNRQILNRFNETGLDFAFPSQTLYLASDDKRGLTANLAEQNSN